MGKKAKPNLEYAEKMFTIAGQHNGFFTQAQAARILNMSETQITKLAKKGVIFKYTESNKAYIGVAELWTEYIKRKSEIR